MTAEWKSTSYLHCYELRVLKHTHNIKKGDISKMHLHKDDIGLSSRVIYAEVGAVVDNSIYFRIDLLDDIQVDNMSQYSTISIY